MDKAQVSSNDTFTNIGGLVCLPIDKNRINIKNEK